MTAPHKPLGALAEQIQNVNRLNGWFEVARTPGEDAALLHSEVSEFFEEVRKGSRPDENYYTTDSNGNTKPEGIPSELADVIIRALDTAYRWGIDIDDAVAEKLAYNATRGHRHGGKVL